MADAASDVADSPTPPISFSDILEQNWFATYFCNLLSASNALRFAATCRTARVVRLMCPNPGHERSRTWRNDADRYHPHDWQELDLIGARSALRGHSVFLRCKWKDQGWGNKKGMLAVVRDGGKAPDDYQPWGEAVVCGKEPAPHEWEDLYLMFRLDGNEGCSSTYRLCARPGGGGGHSLEVRDMTVRELLFVDSPEALQAYHHSVERLAESLSSELGVSDERSV